MNFVTGNFPEKMEYFLPAKSVLSHLNAHCILLYPVPRSVILQDGPLVVHLEELAN